MHTFDEIAGYLDDIIDDIPEYVTKSLSGGVYLIPEAKHHPTLPFPQYVVMGEYIRDPVLGPHIHVYYNSIMSRYVDASEAEIKKALREIVLHEFRHHVETNAGCRDLELEDKQFVQNAMEKLPRAEQPERP